MLAGVTAQLAVFLVGAFLAGENDSITPGIVMAFVNLMGLVTSPIAEAPSILAKRKAAVALMDKLADTLAANVRDDGESAPTVLAQAIELRDVHFGYEENKSVPQAINARFEAGKSMPLSVQAEAENPPFSIC